MLVTIKPRNKRIITKRNNRTMDIPIFEETPNPEAIF